jgi:hypothetical protein
MAVIFDTTSWIVILIAFFAVFVYAVRALRKVAITHARYEFELLILLFMHGPMSGKELTYKYNALYGTQHPAERTYWGMSRACRDGRVSCNVMSNDDGVDYTYALTTVGRQDMERFCRGMGNPTA